MRELDRLTPAAAELLERFGSGARVGLARAISMIEDEREGYQAFLHEALKGGPQARRVGMTGPPGAGKSSLLAGMAARYRAAGEEIGVVAVDPTSPFSGGALLGDRIRMNDLATDPGIFIRSMATRGSLGGLAATTREVVDLMDAFGFPRVIVETVGVGQTELEITGAADTVVVVLVPESGDAIQAMKAGLMEIADIFVVNKADRPGADRIVRELRLALHMRVGEALRDIPAHHGIDLTRRAETAAARAHPEPVGEALHWEIPVLKTVAQSGDGVDELLASIERHRQQLEASGELARRRRARTELRIRDVIDRELRRRVRTDAALAQRLRAGLERVTAGTETPYSVASAILGDLLREPAPR
jgi:GTPase